MRRFANAAAALIVLLAARVSMGQQSGTPANTHRKVISHVAPQYPELAHRLNLHGVVKVEAEVRPNGSREVEI